MSNELIINHENLPSSADELAKFVLVGREQLVAVRAFIRAIDKVGLAADVYKQKLEEGQEIAEAVLDAETRLGELRANVQRSVTGRPKKSAEHGFGTFNTPLQDFDATVGFTDRTMQDIEKLASHPEVVERVKAEARENGELVTRQSVINAIQAEKKPHVTQNSGNNEWYTPAEIIQAAREVMGSIDLDPASSDIANDVVKADTYYTAETNGLDKGWFGNVWLNPPYSIELIGKFVDKLVESRANYQQAIVLVNNATETKWFSSLTSIASAIVFPTARIKFYMPDGTTGAPLQGQALIYIGDEINKFLEIFSRFGWGAKIWSGAR